METKHKNTEAIPQAELAIADFIAQIPEVSQYLVGKCSDGSIPVFAACDESAGAILKQQISQGLKQYISVGFINTGEVAQTKAGCLAKCTFRVAIASPALLADDALSSTMNLGCAIIRTLNGVCFSSPFAQHYPLNFLSWSHTATMTGGEPHLLSTVEFSAPVILQTRI